VLDQKSVLPDEGVDEPAPEHLPLPGI
jgi:hypothetical protein